MTSGTKKISVSVVVVLWLKKYPDKSVEWREIF